MPDPQDLRGDYQIQLISPLGYQLDLLDMSRVVRLNYSRVLNDYGTFTLTVNSSDDIWQHFGLTDMVVNIWRKNTPTSLFQLDASYFTRFWSQTEDEQDNIEYLIFAGYQLEHALDRRITRPDDDPVAAGGFISRFDSGDIVMSDFVTYQMVSPVQDSARIFSGLTVAPQTGGFSSAFQRRSYAKLMDVIKEVANKTQVDFEVIYTGDVEAETMAMEFRARVIGTDRTFSNNYPTGAFLLFDPRRGNMYSPVITVDRKKEMTYCYVTGQGAEDERVVFPVINSLEVGASIWNRIETVKDARNNEEGDVDGYLSAGLEALNDAKVETSFDFAPDLKISRYNVEWFLGDRATAQYADYMRDVRIKRVTIDLDDDETITIELHNEGVG